MEKKFIILGLVIILVIGTISLSGCIKKLPKSTPKISKVVDDEGDKLMYKSSIKTEKEEKISQTPTNMDIKVSRPLTKAIVKESLNTSNTSIKNYYFIYPNSRPYHNIPDNYNNVIEISTGDATLSMNIIGYYETSDTVNEVLNWYINKLTAMGYYIVEYNPPMRISNSYGVYEYSAIIFGKGDYGIGVWIIRDLKEGKTIYWVGELFVR